MQGNTNVKFVNAKTGKGNISIQKHQRETVQNKSGNMVQKLA